MRRSNSGLASPALPPLGFCLKKKQAGTDLLFNRNYRLPAGCVSELQHPELNESSFLDALFSLSTPSLG